MIGSRHYGSNRRAGGHGRMPRKHAGVEIASAARGREGQAAGTYIEPGSAGSEPFLYAAILRNRVAMAWEEIGEASSDGEYVANAGWHASHALLDGLRHLCQFGNGLKFDIAPKDVSDIGAYAALAARKDVTLLDDLPGILAIAGEASGWLWDAKSLPLSTLGRIGEVIGLALQVACRIERLGPSLMAARDAGKPARSKGGRRI